MFNCKTSKYVRVLALASTIVLLAGCGLPEPPQKPSNTIPPEYVGKHMPAAWWNDDAITDEGRQLYLGVKKGNVNCAKCHGKAGKPIKSGARDFRKTDNMKKYSDSHLLWRISEGIPYSTMRAYKDKLSEEEIWKIIAFTRTFGLKGLQYDPIRKDWVFSGTGQPS